VLAHKSLTSFRVAGKSGVSFTDSAYLPPFLASIVVGPAMWVCNTLLVNRPNGYADLGLYTVADKWRILVLFVRTTLVGMALPLLSNLHGKGDSVGYGNLSNANLLIKLGLTIVPAAAIAVCAIPIMSIYGSSYRAGCQSWWSSRCLQYQKL
jgi:O-antigen/teichoic acid export membrane protein